MTILEYLRGKGVPLHQVSHTMFKAGCPLPGHDDKDPSFAVYVKEAEMSCWCFGCQRGGDVWSLVQLMERCGFRRAVEIVGRAPERLSHSEREESNDPLVVVIPKRVRRLLLAAGVRRALMSGEIGFEEADIRYRSLLEGYEIGKAEAD